MLECWNLRHKSRITYNDNPWCQKWRHPPSLQSGTLNVLQVWLRGWGVLDPLLFMLENWKLAHKSRITYNDDPWCQEWPHPPSIQSGTINILQVWLQGRGVLDTLLFMLESWNLAHKSSITYHDDPWCQELPHPPSIQSGTLNILQVWTSRTGGSWHTSHYARELKFGRQVKNHISWWSMLSKMTSSSKTPLRNNQCPPSMDFKDWGFLTNFYSC